MPAQLDQLWDDIRDELRRETPDFKFHIWIDPLELAAVRGDDALRARARAHPHLGRRALPAAAARAPRRVRFDAHAAVEIVGAAWSADADGGPPRAARREGAGTARA